MKTLTCILLLAVVYPLRSQTSYISELPLNNLEILDDVVNDYQVFLTGENHYYTSENTNIKLQMLKYLHRKAGVRNLILELGFSRGFMLDKFINDDSSYYEQMRYTTSVYFLEMYKALRVFNQSLDSQDRIRIHGIDVERFADDGPILLAKLLPQNRKAPASIDFSVEVIRSYGAYSMKRYQNRFNQTADDEEELDIDGYYYEKGFFDGKTIDTMIADYQLNRRAFRDYLGADFDLFDKVFTSVIEYRRYMGYANMPHQYVYRERMIYDNLSALMTNHPGERYYGQFGRCHISQTELNEECDWWAFSSVAKRLNEGSARDRVLSIGIFYNNNTTDVSYNENYFDNDVTTEELEKYLDMDCSNTNILTRIDRKDTSLVKHYQYLIYNNPCRTKKSVRDDYHASAFMLDFGYGMAQFNLGNLNAAMPANMAPFDPLLSFFSLGWSQNKSGFYTNTGWRWFVKQKQSQGPVKYVLGGFSITHSLGYMPHISKRFAMGAYASFGWNKLNLNVQNDSAAVVMSPGFSEVDQVKYVNNGFVIGGGIDMRFAFSRWIGMFVRANYLYDVSRKYWTLSIGDQNVPDKNSPKTSVGYYGLNAGLSILIQK